MAHVWRSLREEVQQPNYWEKWKKGWDTTKLLLKEPAETQAAFVLAAVRKTLKPEEKPTGGYLSAVGRFLSRVVAGENLPLATLVVSPRTIPLDQMDARGKEHYIDDRTNYAATSVVNELVRRRVALTEGQVVELLKLYAPAPRWPPQSLLKYLLRLAEKLPRSPEMRDALENLRRRLQTLRTHSDQQKQLQSIASLLDDVPSYENAKGPWLEMVLKEVDASQTRAELWREMLEHCAGSEGASSKRWREQSAALIESLGREGFRDAAIRWLGAGVTPGEARRQLKPGEADLLKGFIWMLTGFDDLKVASAVAEVAEECFRKIPQIGAVSHRVGNACVNALAEMPGMNAVGQLSRVRARMKYSTAKRLVEKALDQAAQRAGLTRNDLEDMAVPTFDFQPPGVSRREQGKFAAELVVTESAKIAIRWSTVDGKTLKSAPAEIKKTNPELLRTLRRTAKDAEQMLRAQRSRLEKLFFSEHSPRYEEWRKRTVEHPLLAQMTRRLIWQFECASGRKRSGMWHADALVAADGNALQSLEGTRVRLWHPLGADVKTVLAWRKWLQEREITQPFKQAHREIYVLTDAERRTETYSNRFAAHILSQHILNALCRERGWENRLQGQFDSGRATPTLKLPDWGFIVEFWVQAPPDAPTSASGISLYVSTDQVRFCDMHGVAVALERIPPLVFSEGMRDVDLFVGVTSIANDPAWVDQGERTTFVGYWHSQSFGELSATAMMRREVLGELLPKLKIRDRCQLGEKFLEVRGERATYKIHLGSGNILMEPGSRYLCIVPGRGSAISGEKAAARVFLPFEGDNMLAIILSKAFLLADDTKITDPTILRQLPR